MRHTIAILVAGFFIAGCTPSTTVTPPSMVSGYSLTVRSYDELASVAQQVRGQSRSVDEFAGIISVMKATVSDYADIIKIGGYASNALRVLPIPYAGEVSNGTKLVSMTLVHINNATTALDRYKKSSTKFLNDFDALHRERLTAADVAKVSAFADETLMNDAMALQEAMGKIAKTSESLVALSDMMAKGIDTTSGYWDTAKGLVGMQPSAKEKETLGKTEGFRGKLVTLNQKIAQLESSARLNRKGIAKSRVMADIALEVEQKGSL